MRTILACILIIVSTNIFGQQAETLLLKVHRTEVKDGFFVYDVSVQNETDSLVCILHSIFMNLTAGEPQGLALYVKSKEKEEYGLHRTFDDTTYDAEAAPRKGEFILPHQSLNFKIKILQSTNDISKWLTMQYFYSADICYKDSQKEMIDKPGGWYYKYQRLKKSVKL